MKSSIVFALLCGLATSAINAPADAQDFPQRTITLVCPFPAGGCTDILARMLAQELQDKLKQTLIDVVRRRPGALSYGSSGAGTPHHLFMAMFLKMIVVKNQTNRQREVQFALARFVELAAVEARADDVQLCLGERALQAEHQAVVELGRVVTAVLVDYQRACDGAQLEQAMPILVRSC